MSPVSIDDRIFYAAQDVAEELDAVGDDDVLPRMIAESRSLRELIAGFDEPLLIEVAGNIGFGKTTVAQIIENQTGMRLVQEDDSDFLLKRYYEDMEKDSEKLQLHLISKRFYELVIEQSRSRCSIVCDRSPYEDPLVFARVLHENELMTQAELENVFWYFENFTAKLREKYPSVKVVPDLLIHVYGDIEMGWQRIQQRKRSMEVRADAAKGKGLTYEFYTALQERYAQNFIKELRDRHWYDGPVFPLDQSRVGISDAKMTKGWLYIVSALKKSLELIKEQGR